MEFDNLDYLYAQLPWVIHDSQSYDLKRKKTKNNEIEKRMEGERQKT